MRPRWATWPGCGSCGFRFLKSNREWEPDESAAVGLGIAEIQDEAVFDPKIADFISKIAVVVDAANGGKFAPAVVRVKTSSGETIDRRLDHVPGTLENPLSDAELAAKFRDCAAFGLKPLAAADADGLATTLDRLVESGSLGEIFIGIHG